MPFPAIRPHVLLLLLFAFAPSCAGAQTLANTARILELIKKESAGCRVNLQAMGTMSTGQDDNWKSEFVVLWIYNTEGCNGGNNWRANVSAFYVQEPERGPSVVRQIPFARSVMEQTLFATVKNVAFKAEPKKANGPSLSSVEIDGLSEGVDDSHCCPTAGHQVKLWIEDGKIKSLQTKTWKEKE